MGDHEQRMRGSNEQPTGPKQSKLRVSRPVALLVHPWITDFAAYDFWIQPLGLLFMAAFLRSRGWQVRLIDALDGAREAGRRRWDGTAPLRSEKIDPPAPVQAALPEPASSEKALRAFRRYGISRETFRARLAEGAAPDAILVTSQMTYWYPGVHEAVRGLRQGFPHPPLILGGGYAALAAGHARLTPGVDALVTARALPAALRQLAGHLGMRPPTRREWADLVPAWDLYPALPHAALLTSWGCPFRCPYCATPQTQGVWRARDCGAVLAEVAQLRSRAELSDLAFYDDALLHRAGEQFLPLAERIVAGGAGRARFRWHLPNAIHARWVTRPVAAALRELGVATLWFGVESFDPDFQRTSGCKLQTAELDSALRALDAEQARPRQLGAYLLAGLPGLSSESVRASIDAAHQRGLRVALASYSPIPGTPLFDQAARREPALRCDPIWQNNTLREMRGGGQLAQLRRYAREGNARLSHLGGALGRPSHSPHGKAAPQNAESC